MVEVTPADRDAAINLDELHIIQVWNIDRVAAAFAHHRQYGYDQGYYDGRRYRQPTQSDALREAVIDECAKALEADARLCDCAALEDRECACGAWDDYKSITSARAVEIIRALQEQSK